MSVENSDLIVDVVVTTQMCWVVELILEDLDGCSVFSDAILSCCTNFSSRTKMIKMDGGVLPEGDVHLGDVLEPIDVLRGYGALMPILEMEEMIRQMVLVLVGEVGIQQAC